MPVYASTGQGQGQLTYLMSRFLNSARVNYGLFVTGTENLVPRSGDIWRREKRGRLKPRLASRGLTTHSLADDWHLSVLEAKV